MIWDSVILMSVIDLSIIAGVALLIRNLYKYGGYIIKLDILAPVSFVVAGLFIISVFYAADLYSMHFLPLFVPREDAMRAMEALHQNWSWPTMLLGISCIVAGLLYLIARMFPEVAVIIDSLRTEVGERERAESALRAAQDELLRKERLATLGQLTGTVSHELRNPLGAMRTAMAAIKKLSHGDEPMLARSIEIVDRSIVRCDNIVGDLLDYSRVHNLNPEPMALDGWLSGLLDEYEIPPGITLARELRSRAVPAFDRDRLRRVVINLLDNACQAMAEDDVVAAEADAHLLTVATCQADGRVEISIGDTGPGISDEAAGRVFEPLFSTKAFGVGLGLPIVKQVLEQHDGGVEVDRMTGRGTRMVVWLPLPVPLLRAAS
jgi:signal transduction histidine kinase